PHVSMCAVPEAAGVHWNTRSPAVPELAQLPSSWLGVLVVPVNVPPAAAMTVGLAQLPPTSVRMNAPRPWVKATAWPVTGWTCRSYTATLGIPVSGPRCVHVLPPSRLLHTPLSVPT